MKLAAFFEAIAPMIHGQRSAAETALALYGERAGERDGLRLAKYAKTCRATRFALIADTYLASAAAVRATAGDAAWEALVDGYFRAHPMRHAGLPANGDQFAEHTRSVGASLGLAPWIADIADLEWREWETTIAAKAPEDEDPAGPLRLASTVSTRPYDHQVVEWLDAEPDARSAAPVGRPSLVLFWRDAREVAQRAAIGRSELHVLRRLRAAGRGQACEQEAMDDVEREAFEALREMGVVLGVGPVVVG